jgi:hypothetical protein
VNHKDVNFLRPVADELAPRTDLRRNAAFLIAAQAALRNFSSQTLYKKLCGLCVVQQWQSKVDSIP